MPNEPVEKKPKKRTRRNYAKELERVENYLSTVIRIKDREPSDERTDVNIAANSELRAYRDVLDFLQGGTK